MSEENKCPPNAQSQDFYLLSLLSFSPPPPALPLSPSEPLQGLKMTQIFEIRPHPANANIPSSSQLLQDTLIVRHLQAAKQTC